MSRRRVGVPGYRRVGDFADTPFRRYGVSFVSNGLFMVSSRCVRVQARAAAQTPVESAPQDFPGPSKEASLQASDVAQQSRARTSVGFPATCAAHRTHREK